MVGHQAGFRAYVARWQARFEAQRAGGPVCLPSRTASE
jgi:hypothetical protein